MLTVTLVLAVVGTVTGVGSLGWQIISFQRSGPVVKLRVGYPQMPVHDKNGNLFYTVIVSAFNVGRGPITVSNWGIRLPDNDYLDPTFGNPPASEFSDPLPFRLESGNCGTWFMSLNDIDKRCDEYCIRRKDLIAFVELADGTVREAPLP